MAFATGVLLLLAGRLVVGIGVGIASFIVPVYLAEIAPSRIRGRMIGMNIVLVTGGQFISILICYSLNGEWR